jgi:hypothetical protein
VIQKLNRLPPTTTHPQSEISKSMTGPDEEGQNRRGPASDREKPRTGRKPMPGVALLRDKEKPT